MPCWTWCNLTVNQAENYLGFQVKGLSWTATKLSSRISWIISQKSFNSLSSIIIRFFTLKGQNSASLHPIIFARFMSHHCQLVFPKAHINHSAQIHVKVARREMISLKETRYRLFHVQFPCFQSDFNSEFQYCSPPIMNQSLMLSVLQLRKYNTLEMN